MNEIRINDTKRTIEITKSFSNKASYYGSDEYNLLKGAKQDNPKYKVVIKTTKSKTTFKGLTFEYMESYINSKVEKEKSMETPVVDTKDTEDKKVKTAAEILSNFYTLCGREKDGSEKEFAVHASYGEIKKWFLDTYPEFNNFRSDIDNILGKKAA